LERTEQNASPDDASLGDKRLDPLALQVQPGNEIIMGDYEEGEISGEEEFFLIQMEEDNTDETMLGEASGRQLQLPVADSTSSTAAVTADPAGPLESTGAHLFPELIDFSRKMLMYH
jgi:hypothetical protein